MKLLPVGLASLSELINGNYVYVDKTKLAHEMITTGKYYFLSRPRRFGKSLLVSTLEEIFRGNKESFKDLWIEKSGYGFKPHPIIKLDFATITKKDPAHLQIGLTDRLNEIARDYQANLSNFSTLEGKFLALIKQLAQQYGKVVILIDEYDKPILDHIHNPEKAEEQRALLQEFYGAIKGSDEYIRFAFFTGVSKFTRTSIFSGLNNMRDITMSSEYSTLLGYTQAEIKTYFKDRIAHMAKRLKTKESSVYSEIEEYYDGYRFAADAQRVYNPFSVLNCLAEGQVRDFWFATGTPTFIIKLIRQGHYGLEGILNPTVSETSLEKSEINRIPLPTLLLQAGYLTIKSSNLSTHTHTLGVPNREVNDALMEHLLDAYSGYESEAVIAYTTRIFKAFDAGDMDELLAVLQRFMDNMPYHTTIKDEEPLRALFFITFSLIGIRVQAEVATSPLLRPPKTPPAVHSELVEESHGKTANHRGFEGLAGGRADLVVELRNRVYIIELKLGKRVPARKAKASTLAQAALKQITDREYYAKYLETGKQITLIGMAVESDTRKVQLASKVLA